MEAIRPPPLRPPRSGRLDHAIQKQAIAGAVLLDLAAKTQVFKVRERFGVATECGMGRRPPETIPELLRIHAAVSR